MFRQRAQDIRIQEWHAVISESSRFCLYNDYKYNLNAETYLLDQTVCKFRRDLTKLRVGTAGLAIDTGRNSNMG